ncbi:hypothetical protein [Streptomyces ficellus]|uniref:Uncharacterized protein n=1 Tax=Streptomyces ficellus TaxID=1977088 RepID=A0A6I6FQU6_9ACTN|nr:hypothetical protein [Streptomyces ficellus]QGV82005.1 hypothetical protein EIZ62_29910 [Streptomyces ficellus]
MTKLIRRQCLDADVGYHSFSFQESDDAALPVPYPDAYDFGTFLSAHPGRIDFFSAGHTHTAAVTVEVWDGPAPELTGTHWDEQGEVEFESVSGQVAVWSMSLGRTDELIVLSPGLWRVRASCTGRAEAERLSLETGTAKGAEKYLVQFWPKRS